MSAQLFQLCFRIFVLFFVSFVIFPQYLLNVHLVVVGAGRSSRNLLSTNVVYACCRAEFQLKANFCSLALKNCMEQMFTNNMTDPFSPGLVAEYLTKGVVAEYYYTPMAGCETTN